MAEVEIYFLALLCKSLCSLIANTRKFLGSLFRGFLFLWCITNLLGGCFLPVLSDLKSLRFIISYFSCSDNKLILRPLSIYYSILVHGGGIL